MLKRTIVSAVADLREQRVTAEVLVREAFSSIQAHEHLNAFAFVDFDNALAAARDRDRALASGNWTGPLHGIPLTIKDLFQVAGQPTRAGTRAPLPPLGPEGAAVQRLRAAGAIFLGKTNMHEVALGLSGENPWTGDVKNPHDPARQAGGSSGGSAVAVAIGAGLASLGTDTGGSIRCPAGLCGVVGFKPSYGLVPFDGALPLSPTCDHAGGFARDAADMRLLTEVLAGRSLSAPFLVSPPRLGVPRAFLEGRLTASMRSVFEALIHRLADRGVEIVELTIDGIEEITPHYTALVWAEGAFVHRTALEVAPEDFCDGVRAALLDGFRLQAVDYLAARAYRRRLQAGLSAAFDESGVCAIILPSTPGPAQLRGTTMVALEAGSVPWRDAHIPLTAPFSFAGVPALSFPFAYIDGLPMGLQIVAPFGEDARALNLAAWMEAAVAS